jgi:phosphoglycolate phosphatase-like HAD superfamily hydrolase
MNPMSEEYERLETIAGDAYLRKNRVGSLRNVNGIIFDCDGTLLDTSNSYDKTILSSVNLLLEGFLGKYPPGDLISEEIIFYFRKSGGFNDDWDTVYGILVYYLCNLPFKLRIKILESIRKIDTSKDPYERFSKMRSMLKLQTREEDFDFDENIIVGMKEFTNNLGNSGIESIDYYFADKNSDHQNLSNFYNALKDFLRHPEDVGKGIISTVFEEYFCGSSLFKETYLTDPNFVNERGFIENSKIIVLKETMLQIISLFGDTNVGIASGSRYKAAEYVLGKVLDFFNKRAIIFLDDIEKFESINSVSDIKINLKKPNPFSIQKSAEAFENTNMVLYVGDSVADCITVNNARKENEAFLFTGVYRQSFSEGELIKSFMEHKGDLILPTVNEIPEVFMKIRSRK